MGKRVCLRLNKERVNIENNLKDLFREINNGANKKALRSFGIVFTIFLCLFYYGIFYYLLRRVEFSWIPLSFGIGFSFMSLLFPLLIKPFYVFWMLLGAFLGFINTKIILLIIFYFIVTPVSLIFGIIGKDPLRIRGRNSRTYFLKDISGNASERKGRMKFPF